jgi:hypothetical protein
VRIANRKARAGRESDLNALQAFVNMGVTPEDWKSFRRQYREFFPKNLSEWFYDFAEELDRKLPHHPESDALKPPLLFYRDRLRRVWTRDDHEGINLKLLLGLEQEVKDEHVLQAPFMPGEIVEKKRGKCTVGAYIPGQPIDPDQQTTFAGLPPGKPIVNGVTGEITWKFGCTFQQSVCELMRQRWRAMVCPECGKFFLADKPRQTYCSTACSGEKKRKQALDYYNRKGRADRIKRRVKERK